jgi:hypothetical protein
MKRELIEQCAELEGVGAAEGAFAPGPAICVGKREVAHFDADGALDVRLTKQVIHSRRSELEADDRISLRASGSDWLELKLDTASDH